MTAIIVEHLDKRVSDATGSLAILQDIGFELSEGTSLAILGASGSGKSTLLGLLAGLDLPSGGTVRVFGRNLYDMDEDERAAWRASHVGSCSRPFNCSDK